MIIVTNRNLQKGKTPTEIFGKDFNSRGPDELRLAQVSKDSGSWRVNVIDDVIKGSSKMYSSERAFLDIQARMGQDKKNCLFFVHGFNTDFESVLERCLGFEQNYNVEVIAFTWPANGREGGGFFGEVGGVVSYKSDKRDAVRSSVALDRTLEKLNLYFNKYGDRTKACNQKVSIMFHSMGNYLFKNLMKSSIYTGETSLFDNVIMASADVNNKDHANWVDKIQYRKRLYITINEEDQALQVSRMKFGSKQQARLGHFTHNLNSTNSIYLDFTSAKHVNSEHAYFEGSAIKNPNVKSAFKTIINGGKVEENLVYNPQSRAFTVS